MKNKIAMTTLKYFYKCFKVPGGRDLQKIMYGIDARYYNAGVYGWNCDIFTDEGRNIAICDGYRNTRGQTIPLKLWEKYDAKSQNIIQAYYDNLISYDERVAQFENLRNEFFEALDNL